MDRVAEWMSAAPARLAGLDRSKGRIAAGYDADLVIFDPEEVADRATFDDPHQYAAGIAMVIVNGMVVIDAGEHTGALPGQVLRRHPDGIR